MISGQEPILLLQLAHQIRQLLHHTLERAKVLLLREHDAEVEDELIAVIALRLDANRVAQNPLAVRAHLNQVAAELLARDHKERNVRECKEEGL